MFHQSGTLGRIAGSDELVDRIDHVFFIVEQVKFALAVGLVVVRCGRACRGQLCGVLHNRDQFRAVADDDPVELASVTGVIEVLADQSVQRHLHADGAHHGDHTLGKVLVGGIVRLGQKRDVQIRPASDVHKAVAIGVLQARLRQFGFGRSHVERIVNGGGFVVIGRPVIQAARIDRGERAFHQAVAQTLAVKAIGNRLAEVEVAVQIADRLAVGFRLAPAIAGQVREQRIADGARAKRQLGGRGRVSGLFQAFDIVFSLFQVGKVTGSGHSLHVTVSPG